MKKLTFLLAAVILFGSVCFAEEVSAPAGEGTPAVKVKLKTFIGEVSSINAGNTMAGMNPQIVATDDKGKQWTFQVASDAVILDKNGECTSLSWIGRDTRVEIKYAETPDGPKMVQSLKVLKDW